MGRLILTLPRLGETMEEAKVTEWLVAPGAAFARGDVLLEVETDKTVVEVPALTAGILTAQLVAPGDTVALDHPIAEVEVEGSEAAPEPAPKPEPSVTPASPLPSSSRVPSTDPRPAASPAARAAARRAGVDLTAVSGTGRRGRIQASDVPSGQGGQAAQTLVFIHGLFDTAKGWRDLPRRLQAAGHRVVLLDLPGHADNPPASDVEQAVDRLAAGVPSGPLCLIGHSLGAALAARLARRLGQRVGRLILSAPLGLGPRINADFTDGMLACETPAALAHALGLLDTGPLSAQVLSAELARLQTLRVGHAALSRATARLGFQQIDITTDLARLTCPILVLFGTQDRILHWQDVAHLPAAAAVHLIKGAGHLPHLAAPELFLSLILQTHLAPERTTHA